MADAVQPWRPSGAISIEHSWASGQGPSKVEKHVSAAVLGRELHAVKATNCSIESIAGVGELLASLGIALLKALTPTKAQPPLVRRGSAPQVPELPWQCR